MDIGKHVFCMGSLALLILWPMQLFFLLLLLFLLLFLGKLLFLLGKLCLHFCLLIL